MSETKKTTGSGPGRPKDLVKRQAILEAAKQLFLRNGYDGSSMDAIAARAGVSKLTVYSHFTDKETLFSEAVKAKCEEQLPDLIFALPPGVPADQVLRNIGQRFLQLIDDPESLQLHRLMIAMASQDPTLARLFFEAGPQRVLDVLARLLLAMDHAELLRVKQPARAAEHFLCLLKGAHHFRLLLGCSDALDAASAAEHLDDVVGLFVRAYRP
ncbi:TetR/AcrR family transcriptional regulator [Pseudomonas mangiferae]|uniref:TetR/AcrR family transcriptional regulator n=1 Tax=Pseudomonas mangiferae TaxID=2593654 RepID=A0A553H1D8_9PSED|nr:TetR/AcrR family transcriptional regulator [Pseudomonas mangiferae]TRX75541.1 TetR/AcrR family transcriptional regulator [Pseudomonas mangiferae]